VSQINVGIIGVGNCASSLIQGIHKYKDISDTDVVPGIMHPTIGSYNLSDINIVAAFDVDANKVGKDISEVVFLPPNNTIKFADVPHMGVSVDLGMAHDGIGKYVSERVQKAEGQTQDIVAILKERNCDIVINYLPVGSEKATKWYVEQIIASGCGFINCIPVFIAREDYWQQRFKKAGLPIIGDDIKSLVGATITHRTLTNLFNDRGVKLLKTYQLNFGGNTDFLNMLERERLASKKESKTNAVTSQLNYELGTENVHVGPSDYVPWLEDRKWCHIRMEGESFGGTPITLELKLEVWDSPNSAGVVVDAIRCCKLAMDQGISGAVEAPSAYFMKSPPIQYTDDEARQMVEDFIDVKKDKRGNSKH